MKINFYLRQVRKDAPNTPRPVYLFLTYSPGKRIKHPVGKNISVRTEDWEVGDQRADASGNFALTEINQKINTFEARVRVHFTDLWNSRVAMANATKTEAEPLTRAEVKHELNVMTGVVKSVDPESLTGFIVSQCAEGIRKAKANDKGTYKSIENFLYHWKSFMATKRTKPDWFNVDHELLQDFANHISKQTARKGGSTRMDSGRKLAVSTRMQILSTLYGLLTTAVIKKYMKFPIHSIIDPSTLIGEDEDVREDDWYLTFEEITQLAEVDLSKRVKEIQKTRDAFVSACLNGQRVGDWKKLSADVKHTVVNGLPFQKIETQKGRKDKKRAFVPIHSFTMEALRKWGSFDQSLQAVNVNLRKIAAAAGLDRVVLKKGEEKPLSECISSHLARKTFESNLRELNTPQKIIDLVTTHGKKQQSDFYDTRSLAKKMKTGVKYLVSYETEVFTSDAEATIRKIA